MAEFPNFLVIGCGSIGQRHISNLKALGVKGIVAFDPQADRRSEIENLLGVSTVESLESGWAKQPDVALIAAPTNLHMALALEAANHGCHLFVEKPLGDRLDGAEELISIIQQRGLTTLVGCNMRFHHGPATIKKLLDQGTIGQIINAHLEMGQYLPDWHPHEDYRQMYSAKASMGGGVVLDGIHEIDYARWHLGEVDEVCSQGGKVSSLEIDTEDTVDILMKMAAGFTVSIHLDYVQRSHTRTCKVVGSEGTISWDMAHGEVRMFTAARQQWQTFPQPEGYDNDQMYIDEMQHFLNCLAGDEQPSLDVSEGKRVLELALAIKQSMTSGEPQNVGL